MAWSMQPFVAMADDATRTLWSRETGGSLDDSFLAMRRTQPMPQPKAQPQPQPQPQPKADPTSWNGISYDDMMRTLEDALPESERPTLVGCLPDTQPAPFTPPKRAICTHAQPATSVAPVAMPSMAPIAPRLAPAAARPRRGKVFLIGAALGTLVAVAAFASTDPTARASAKIAATDARAHASGWLSRVTAESSKRSTAAATPPPPPPAPVVAEPASSVPPTIPPTVTAVSVPQMRAPTPPPPRRVVTKNKPTTSDDVEPTSAVIDPSSLLNHGLGD